MLILTRNPGERIFLFNGRKRIAEISYLGINGYANKQQIKLGINASKNITILREEVYSRKKQNSEDFGNE